MPLAFITGEPEYAFIRSLIRQNLDARSLPGTVISNDGYAGQAERYVLERTLNSDTGTPAGSHAKLAALYYCAAMIAPTVPKVTGESEAGTSYSQKWDSDELEKRAAQLYEWADREIAAAERLSPTQPPVRLAPDGVAVGFDVASAPGRRPEGSEAPWPPMIL